MTNLGVNISRQSYQAYDDDPLHLVATSLKKQLKITTRGSGTITVPNGDFESGDRVIDHGLGYEPGYMAYFEHPDDLGRYWIVHTGLGGLGETLYSSESRVDTFRLVLKANRGGSAETGDKNLNYAYFLLDQPAAEAAGGNDKPIGYVDSKQGIIVSEPGIDADQSKIYQQQFNSNTDYLKYHLTQDGKFAYNNTSNGADTFTLTHNLGYIPMFMVYGDDQLDAADPFYAALPIGTNSSPFSASGAADKTNITVNIAWAGSMFPDDKTYRFRIVVFKNRMVV